jgi:superfamily I DNA/RNA helicase
MVSFIPDHNLRLPKYDLVMVDEAQDMNRLQLEILKRLLTATGRLVAIGDSFQSIYGFRGADTEAMNRIRSEFNVAPENQLPLSITYRCPKAVVRVAQEWVPHIQAADTAPEGEVIERTGKQLGETMLGLNEKSMVICRCNAPLVSAALKLIAQGRKAIVRGRDIGKSIEKLVVKLAKRLDDSDVAGLAENVRAYQEVEMAKMMRAHRDTQAQQVEDRCATIFALLAGISKISILMSRIETLFSDNFAGVVHSSIHRSKGLEADTIVWLGPELNSFFMSRAKNASALQQEKNLAYVAASRAKQTLIYQPIPDEKDEENEADVAFGSAH